MNKSLGSIGDLFPDKNIRCRIPGCSNSWQMAGDEAVKVLASADPELPERMCEECFQAYKTLQDQDVPCSKAGCEATWRWSRFQQLVSRAKGYKNPPRRLCSDCQKGLANLADQEMPCRMKGCDGTWTWSKNQQLNWEKERPPSRLCENCFARLQQFEDKQFACRVRGCEGKWTWNAYQQLEYEIMGKDPEKPPRRMCRECVGKLRGLEDKELPCKIKECSRTWTWTAYAQLEQLLAGKSLEDVPSRLCRDCFDYYRQVQDVQRSCKVKGCRNTWIYSKGWQLRDWLKGREHPPAMMCDECREKLKQLASADQPCDVPGCQNTWSYQPADQLKDQLSGRRQPRKKHCDQCDAFLHDNSFINVPCEKCGCDIPWSPYEQLLVAKGTFAKPKICSGCAEGNLPASKPSVTTAAEHHLVIRVPKGGKWGSDPEIAAWPLHLNHDVIARAEKADIRIVALGDDLTYSAENARESWPWLLEQKLNAKLEPQGLTATVANAGIAGTNSKQAVARLKRDVFPFQPHLVLLSFAFGDAILQPAGDRWSEKIADQQAESAMKKLLQELLASGTRVLYWTTNPMFPKDRDLPKHLAGWADAQEARKSQMLAHALRLCSEFEIPVLQLRARFEVNGTSSAKKWMSDWYNHNLTGATNIATWMATEISARHLPEHLVTD